ncbi:MAG: peptide-methionine (S)-S-oxide reductase MsrA [Sphingomonadales bacterium]
MAKRETAILAGGCFWCVEAIFKALKGVEGVRSGYIGGHVKNPSYKEVCSGSTGHAEAIEIAYDPDIISFDTLLDVFFATHDPTQLNRQGNDIGTQYRSAIFVRGAEDKNAAREAMKRAGEIWDEPIVTTIEPLTEFYVAEDYHQDYFENNPGQPYCAAVVAPKVMKARAKFTHLLQA